MKLRTLVVTLGILLTAGCGIKSYEPTAPTASENDIKMAREWLSDVSNLKISDDGYINYVEALPGSSSYKWNTTNIKRISQEWSCGNMYPLLEKGFVIRLLFKGKGGKEELYDKARCDAEETN
ncbi:hypothetical protein [Vibrio penaeicida]|uniref:hypothetical protein n=1 Tax=Vibrio penaeicida TaxID=104609 RepID=UPI000CEA2930|nr:hypothetical protein [Vibrio penaeicida]